MSRAALLSLTGAFALVASAGNYYVKNNENPQIETTQTAKTGTDHQSRLIAPVARMQNMAFPDAPEKLGDYDRTLPLQRCQNTLGPQYNNVDQVVYYLMNPASTPEVISPEASPVLIERAQKRLQTLGFNVVADGDRSAFRNGRF